MVRKFWKSIIFLFIISKRINQIIRMRDSRINKPHWVFVRSENDSWRLVWEFSEVFQSGDSGHLWSSNIKPGQYWIF